MNIRPRKRRSPDAPPRNVKYVTAEVILGLMADCPPERPTEGCLRMMARCEELLREEAALLAEGEASQ